MKALCAGILSLLFAGAMYAQQPLKAKLVVYRDASTQNDPCMTTGTQNGCSPGSVRVYTLEIGPMVYDVEAADLKVSLLTLGQVATRGPLYNQAIGTDWQVTMDGKSYIRVLGPKKGKGYRFQIVGEHSKS
jgi:hypothetical protein